MFIKKVMLAPVITEVMPMLCSPIFVPPISFTYLSGPQYLVTFHTSNSRLCMIGMAVRSMTIIPITHFLFLSLNSNLALLFCSSISSNVEIQPTIPIKHIASMHIVNTISSILILFSFLFVMGLSNIDSPIVSSVSLLVPVKI